MQNMPSLKRLTVLFSIIVILFLMAGYLFIVYPSLDKISTLKSQIEAEKTFIQSAGKRMSEQDSDEQNSNHTAPETKGTDQVVLDLRKAELSSKSEIQEIVMDQDASDNNTDIKNDIPLTFLRTSTFTVFVNSPDFDSIKKFIDTFEQSERLYDVHSLEISNEEVGTTPLTYQLEVITYYRK